MAVAAVLAGAALLLVKGLYPQGGHDYYQHYSQFYAAVIDSHGIWPNLFWYQYYYSKGMGVTFLGMLLTDALAPSLVAYCFVVATALALYALVRDFCSHTLWPWLAVVLYLALNVHTLGTGAYFGNGGWGHFQKPHEINSPLMFAVLWMSVTMVRSAGDVRRVWWFGAAACAFVVAYVLLVSPLIVGLFAVLAALYFFARSREVSRMFLGIAVSAGVGLASLLVLNYLTTGAPADVAPNIWWPIVDLRRLNDEGMLFDFVNIAVMRARGAVEGSALADDFDLIEYVGNVFRFDILGVLIGAALMGWLACMIYRDVLRRRPTDNVATIDAPSRQAVQRHCGVLRGDRGVRVHRRDAGVCFMRADQLVRIAAHDRHFGDRRPDRYRLRRTVAAGSYPCSDGCPDPADVGAVGAGIRATQDDAARRRAQRASFC